MVATIKNDLAKIEPLAMPIKTETLQQHFVDSGRAGSIFNQSLASP